jgi:hypothetical protein
LASNDGKQLLFESRGWPDRSLRKVVMERLHSDCHGGQSHFGPESQCLQR